RGPAPQHSSAPRLPSRARPTPSRAASRTCAISCSSGVRFVHRILGGHLMTPMHVHCPECRASLHLMVQLLPARATCTRCHSSFTLNSRPAIKLPSEPAPAPVAPPTAAPPGLLSRLLHAFAVLVLLPLCPSPAIFS